MMRDVDEAWIEALQSEHAEDLVEEILDLIFFGIENDEDRAEVNQLLQELKELGETRAAEELTKKLNK